MKNNHYVLVLATACVTLAGCHVDMWVQPRVNTDSTSDFFADMQGSRPNVPGAVEFDNYVKLDERTTGKQASSFATMIPPVSVKAFGGALGMLKRGQNRYNVFCQPCHGVSGNGNGFVALRGIGYWQKLPANLLEKKLEAYKPGQVFNVITHGKGAMYGYAARLPDVNDRWAIVAYVKALQESSKLALPSNLDDGMHGDGPKEVEPGQGKEGEQH